MTAEPIKVEVAYGLPDRQWLVSVVLPRDARVVDAVRAAERTEGFPSVLVEDPALAVWGRAVKPQARVSGGDRVEVLRPLLIDPRSARRQLAAAGQVMGNRASPSSG